MDKKYLSITELAQYLGLAKGTIYIWVCQKRIPYLKIGKLVKFDLQEIEEWLKDKRIKELDYPKIDANVHHTAMLKPEIKDDVKKQKRG